MTILKRNFFLCFTLIILLFVCCDKVNYSDANEQSVERIQIDSLIKLSKSSSISSYDKLQSVNFAFDIVKSLKNDSIKSKYLFQITNQYYSLKNYKNFKIANSELLKFSIKAKDSMGIADYYWMLGTYYSTREVLDSAFSNYGEARSIFKNVNHQYYQAKMEYNMAYILRRTRNFIKSEEYAYKSISNLKTLDKKLLLYRCYNHLGLLYNDLNQLDESIQYHLKAINMIDEISRKGIYSERSLNNLSLVYQKQKEYSKAIEVLDEALLNLKLKKNHPNLYAKILDNKAYSQLLSGNDSTEVLERLNQALSIRDSMNNEAGIGISKMHISEFYLHKNDSLSAYRKAKEAHEIAVNLGLNRDILNSLSLLAKTNPSEAELYMSNYISLNDSLLTSERKVRDKFTRIQFETDGYIAANEDLKKQNVWISSTSILTLASISLLFLAYRQRTKNKNLILERNQQKANEEIYDLMLKQQHKEEEGRIQERIRISEDLHDGALARLFSVRIGLGFLKVKGDQKQEKRYDEFLKELQLVEKEVRNLSHDLKNDELSSKKDFPKLLIDLLEDQGRVGNFKYNLKQDKTIAWNLVDDKIKLNLYRIIQEAVCNIIKYAQCQHVELILKRDKNRVDIVIVDDGLGFDTNKSHKGIGLQNMKSRAMSIEAQISIKSSPKKGTQIEINIPTKTLYYESRD